MEEAAKEVAGGGRRGSAAGWDGDGRRHESCEGRRGWNGGASWWLTTRGDDRMGGQVQARGEKQRTSHHRRQRGEGTTRARNVENERRDPTDGRVKARREEGVADPWCRTSNDARITGANHHRWKDGQLHLLCNLPLPRQKNGSGGAQSHGKSHQQNRDCR